MSNKTIKPKQEKMIEQVIATMAVENMMLSRDCYKNLWAMASGFLEYETEQKNRIMG